MTLAAIMFGVIGLILSGGFIEDVFVQLREFTIHGQVGHLQVYRDGYFQFGRRDPYRYLLNSPSEIIAEAMAWPEVADVMMRLSFSGLANNGRADLAVLGEGVEPEKEARLGSSLTIVDGRQLDDTEPFGMLIGQGVARSLKLKPGDYLTLLANTPEGALNSNEFKVVGVFRSFSKEYDERAVRIPLAAAQDLLAVSQGIHSLIFSLRNTESTDIVVGRLRELLSSELYDVKAWYEIADFYRMTVELYRRQFGVMQVIILIMVLLSVMNSVNMAVYERTGEFGTLLAIGRRPSDILKMLVVEYMLLGFLGAVLGAGIGILLAWAISQIGIPMPPPPNSDIGYTASIRLVPKVICLAFGVGVIATITAVIPSGWRASRQPIIDALRSNI